MWPHNWSVTWLCGWGPLLLSHHPAKFGVYRPCESGDTFFIFHVTTWLNCHVRFCPFILSQDSAKFESHGSSEDGDLTFFICHVILVMKCLVTLRVGFPHPKFATFRVHRLYGSRNNCVYNISNSDFISHTKIPMPRFTNGL